MSLVNVHGDVLRSQTGRSGRGQSVRHQVDKSASSLSLTCRKLTDLDTCSFASFKPSLFRKKHDHKQRHFNILMLFNV